MSLRAIDATRQIRMAGALASLDLLFIIASVALRHWGIVRRTVVPSSLSYDYSSALACSGLPTERGCALWCGAHLVLLRLDSLS